MTDINLWSVLAAGVSYIILGMIWYSPKGVFGRQWMQLVKRNESEIRASGSGTKAIIICLIPTFVIAYVLAHFVKLVGVTTISGGIQLGFWLWLGFVATFTFNEVVYEQRPMKLYLINNACNLLALMIMGAILVQWQ
ncbi:MAG: DUF1761 domain-containing protein [Patescibacteria group bacterium]